MIVTNKDQNGLSYMLYAKVAIILLILTALNISIAGAVHSAIASGIIVLVAAVQAFIALSWFMHLKFDNLFLRILVISVFVLFIMVVVIIMFDYLFR